PLVASTLEPPTVALTVSFTPGTDVPTVGSSWHSAAALALVVPAASRPRQTARLNNILFTSLHPLFFRPQLWPLTQEFKVGSVQIGQGTVKFGWDRVAFGDNRQGDVA